MLSSRPERSREVCFLLSEIGITVSGIAGGTFVRKTIAFTQHVRSSFASAQTERLHARPSHRISGARLQLIAQKPTPAVVVDLEDRLELGTRSADQITSSLPTVLPELHGALR